MSLKILHISDVHIRNLKYHDDYRAVFEDLYSKIEELKPDIVINTGDTAHTKTQISPEFVEMASTHIRRVSSLVPYHILLGNHDMNLMNTDRQDAITPIVDSINSDRVFLHKKSGLVYTIEKDGVKYNLWAFSLADRENYPTPASWAEHASDINIGLFHGSVSTCITDSNWRMTHVEHDLSIFDGLDFALLGDIHKQQFFRNDTIAYAGSLIQQNFGEDIQKGCLLWELGAKGNNHKVVSVPLRGSRPFYTIRLNDDLTIPNTNLQKGARIRVAPPCPITIVQQKEIEKKVKKLFEPHDIITLSSTNFGEQRMVVGKKTSDIENLRQVVVQERLIRDFLKEKNLSESVMNKILEMNRRHQIHLDQQDTGARNVNWSVRKLGWSNLFNYGEGNIIDFSKLQGLTGLFAPNGSGKSNLIDVLLETLFDSTTKGINKNIFLVNDNKEIATAIAEIVANDQEYEIERQIEKIKYGTRNSDRVKEWGKTSVTFSSLDKDGVRDQLVGTLRPETEANIRQRLGTFDDFMLTSLLAQWNPMDIIGAKETKRKEIIFRFLDLDIFGQKASLAKDESRDFIKKLEELEAEELENTVKKMRITVSMKSDEVSDRKLELSDLESKIDLLDQGILKLSSNLSKVDVIEVRDWDSLVASIEKDTSSILEKRENADSQLTDLENSLSKIETIEKKFDIALHDRKQEEFNQIQTKIDDLSEKISEENAQNLALKKTVSTLSTVPCGENYPGCKFIANSIEAKGKLKESEDLLSELKNQMNALTSSEEELKPFLQKRTKFKELISSKSNVISSIESFKLQIENFNLKLDGLNEKKSLIKETKSKFEKMENRIKKNQAIQQKINELQAEKKFLNSSLSKLRSHIEETVRVLGSHQGVLEKLEAQFSQLADMRDTCTAYEYYNRVMGKDGIPYQVLTQKLPLINEEINKILANVADFGIFLEHDAEEQSIRFYIQYGQYKSRLLELGSGAEKFLASIAIRNALLNISVLPKTNMLLIDEGFGKLDPKNLESIQRMFDYLKTIYDHIIVISHLDSMKDIVDNIIEITTDEEGYAHVSVGE